MKRSLNKAILRLAVPSIVSNITVPLLGLCDTYISGHLGSERYMAAIAVGSMMVASLYWLFGFLRAGTTGLTSEAYGSKDAEGISCVFTLSFCLAVAIGIALIAFSFPLSRIMLALMSPEAETAKLASRYFMICIAAAPAVCASMTVSGWMIGNQNTFFPMIIAVSVNIINIILSFVLVFAFGLGLTGVAIGTLSANWFGLVLAVYLARRLTRSSPMTYNKLWVQLSIALKNSDSKRFFSVNADLMLRSICILSVTFAMTAIGSRMGDTIVAANAVVMQLYLFFSYFCDGFAFGGEAMCGKYAGARDLILLRSTIRALIVWGIVLALIFTLLYFFGTDIISRFMTTQSRVVDIVNDLRWVIALIPIFGATAFILDGVYIGLTATRRILISTVFASVIFFAVSQWLPSNWLTLSDNESLWTGFLLFLGLRASLQSVLLRGAIKTNRAISRKSPLVARQ